MTEEIEILLESLPPEHPHVVEMSELLGGLVAHWQQTIAKIERHGARVAGLDPGRIEWYGVVDNHLMLYSGHVVNPILSGTTVLMKASRPENHS